MTAEPATAAIRAAYAAGAPAWASGPEAVYQRLADALVAECPVPLDAARVLDLGSGTGVATRSLMAAGAAPVGFDLTWEMLAEGRADRPAGVSGDARALPFPAARFDAVVAACVLNHLPPEEPLRECRRVLRPGGAVVASSFPNDRPHPVKAILEPLLTEHGWTAPAWYSEFRATVATVAGEGEALVAAARAAGLAEAEARVIDVEAGLDDVGRLLAWRLSMPHTIDFVTGLPPERSDALLAEARSAVGAEPMPSAIALLVLSARA